MRDWVGFFRVVCLTLLALVPLSGPALAQDQVWIQVQALPTADEAVTDAARYVGLGAAVNGYETSGGWFVLALGPYPRAEAEARLASWRATGAVPNDSYVSDGATYGAAFLGGAIDAAATPEAVEPTVEAAPAASAALEETPEQARAAEAALSAAERRELQAALKWFGFYDGAIDGAFGSGTRRSMAAWQEAQGAEPTGILTTAQRKALVAAQADENAAFGFELVNEGEAGIEVSLPLGLIAFDAYDPPFVRYKATDAGGAIDFRLISLPGNEETLAELKATLPILAEMPQGTTARDDENSFTLDGEDGQRRAHGWVALKRGLIKGYVVSDEIGRGVRLGRIVTTVEDSFRNTGDMALDPALVVLDEATRAGLTEGTATLHPRLSRSGTYLSATGLTVTSAEAVSGCGRITLERDIPAKLVASDPALGLAVVVPEGPLSPAAFAHAAPVAAAGTKLMLAGYSFEDRLPAPALSPARAEDGGAPDGSAGMILLSVQSLPGDAGGPVLNAAGGLVGVLLPPGPGFAGKTAPQGTAVAATPEALSGLLNSAGILSLPAAGTPDLTPDALARSAQGMTALVSCWE